MPSTAADALSRVIQTFKAVPDGNNKWRGACPVCHDATGLIISKGKQGPPAVAFCKHQCHQQTITSAIARAAGTSEGRATLAKFCELKKLPQAWVQANFLVHDGLYTTKAGKDTQGLGFPYIGQATVTTDDAGTHYRRASGGTKYRFSLFKGKDGKRPEAWSHDYKPMLYGLHQFARYKADGVDTSTVVIVEGESDTITLSYCDIPTLGVSGAPNGWKAEYANIPVLAQARRILVVQEPDGAGAQLVQRVASSFPAGKVYAVTLPVKDASDLWVQNTPEKFKAAWLTAAAAAQPVGPLPLYTDVCLADVVPKPITWLWPGRVPENKITVFAGNPGAGKGLATCSLAAIATTGGMYPDEALSDREPIDVLLLGCEDDFEDTVVPRLMAAGADLKRCRTITMPTIVGAGANATSHQREIAFDTDMDVLRQYLADHPRIKLVVVDPISSYLGGTVKPNDEKRMREILLPLRDLAQTAGVTFVLVAHFNKRSDVAALHKVMGAVAITGVARAAWLFAPDDDKGKGHGLMLQGKLNVGRAMDGLEYTIEGKQVLPEPAEPTGYIVWGDATDRTADDTVGRGAAVPSNDGDSKVSEAVAWLAKYLDKNAVPAATVLVAAKEAGIAQKTLYRAKDVLKIKPAKQHGKANGAWCWALPAAPQQVEDGTLIM